jgi:hypothetical protein
MGVIFEVDDGTRFAAKVAQSCIISTAEAQRATFVQEQFRSTIPGILQRTTDVLFRDLSLRPDLAPRSCKRQTAITRSAVLVSCSRMLRSNSRLSLDRSPCGRAEPPTPDIDVAADNSIASDH